MFGKYETHRTCLRHNVDVTLRPTHSEGVFECPACGEAVYLTATVLPMLERRR
jgi:predicted RNA-binding Zn-ribbon protein involved in translation (DUF1610 family)